MQFENLTFEPPHPTRSMTSEPDIEALDPDPAMGLEVGHQLGARPGCSPDVAHPAEPTVRLLEDFPAVLTVGHQCHHLLQGDPSRSDQASALLEPAQMVSGHVPPGRKIPHDLEGGRGRPADHHGNGTSGHRQLLRLDQMEERSVEVDRFTRPEPRDDLECLAETSGSLGAVGVADAKRLELIGRRARADSQLVASTREVIEADRLAGQQRRVPERITQDEVADGEAGGARRQPGGQGHRLEHRLIQSLGRSQMVHEGQAGEPGRFGRLGPVDQFRRGHAHLGEEQVEFGHDASPKYDSTRRAATSSGAPAWAIRPLTMMAA
jgi:hypothetical protein